MCKGRTAVGRSRVLWSRREFGIRFLNRLIVLMLEVIRNLVMCSGWNFNTGEGPNSMCRWTKHVRIRLKLRWITDMIGWLT
jgi:hypothetical protein